MQIGTITVNQAAYEGMTEEQQNVLHDKLNNAMTELKKEFPELDLDVEPILETAA